MGTCYVFDVLKSVLKGEITFQTTPMKLDNFFSSHNSIRHYMNSMPKIKFEFRGGFYSSAEKNKIHYLGFRFFIFHF